MNPINTIINKIIKKDNSPINIFTCFAEDQWFNYELSKLDTWQYIFGGVAWNLTIPKPDNIQILKGISPLFYPDVCISNDRTNQYGLIKGISDASHCPFIIVNHSGPHSLVQHPNFPSLQKRSGFASVYTSSIVREKWGGVGYISQNCVDKEVFTSSENRPQRIILLEPENPQQEMLFKELIKEYEYVMLNGKTEQELCEQFNNGRVFINLNGPHVHFSTLQAMACGCATISAKSDEITAHIKHGENGFLCQTFGEIKQIIDPMMTDKFYDVSKKARQEIGDYKAFQDGWKNIIENSSKIMYER
jgi:hypothetical protein